MSSKHSPQTIALLNGTARTCHRIAEMALARGDTVRAIVRSAPRFHAKLPEQERLTAHEWSDYDDVAGLGPILDGVDAVFIAVGGAADKHLCEPTTLNEQAVVAVSTALHSAVGPGARSPTKLVLLSAVPSLPVLKPGALGAIEKLLGHQYDDLRRAQRFLRTQSSWLDWSVVNPGIIIDSEESGDARARDVELAPSSGLNGKAPHPKPISYARLAHAMLLAADGPAVGAPYGDFYIPTPNGKVRMTWSDMESARKVMGVGFVHLFLPWLARKATFALLVGGLGYVFGVREQGFWLATRFGVNLRSLW